MGVYRAAEADDEYAKLIRRMNPPRVSIDNESCDTATVIRVHSVNRHGILLAVVQVLTDLGLVVTKANICSDGGWFMDVFHVTDSEGNKVLEKNVRDFIEKSIEREACILPSPSPRCPSNGGEYTTIELTGTDRPGLLSEVCAVLAGLDCNVVRAELWTHNSRAAAVVHVTDALTGRAIVQDPERMSRIREFLCNVLKGGSGCCAGGVDDDHHLGRSAAASAAGKMRVSDGTVHTERRLHQLMYEDRDYERAVDDVGCNSGSRIDGGGGFGGWGDDIISRSRSRRLTGRPHVALLDCSEKDYTIAILRSIDRPKLLFDTLCTLTDMQYVVYHGTVDTGGEEAYQEYYIRHVDGFPIRSEGECQRVIQCLEAAIERRACASDDEGVLELELRTDDRVGLLSRITRVFRENGLCIKRAKISTEGGKAVDTFHVSNMSGGGAVAVAAVDSDRIGSIQQQIGEEAELRVVKRWLRGQQQQRQEQDPDPPSSETAATSGAGFLLGSFLRVCSLQSFRLIRSYS